MLGDRCAQNRSEPPQYVGGDVIETHCNDGTLAFGPTCDHASVKRRGGA